jgi:hypothetical protein
LHLWSGKHQAQHQSSPQVCNSTPFVPYKRRLQHGRLAFGKKVAKTFEKKVPWKPLEKRLTCGLRKSLEKSSSQGSLWKKGSSHMETFGKKAAQKRKRCLCKKGLNFEQDSPTHGLKSAWQLKVDGLGKVP